MDRYGKAVAFPVPISQSSANLPTSFIETVLANSWVMGKEGRTGPYKVRNSLHEKDKGDADLPANQKHTGCAATIGSLQAG